MFLPEHRARLGRNANIAHAVHAWAVTVISPLQTQATFLMATFKAPVLWDMKDKALNHPVQPESSR